MNISTSARVGARLLPPKRVHLIAAAAFARRAAASTGAPSPNASAKAPCQTSPAASVSTARTGYAGTRRSTPARCHRNPSGPSVTPTTPGVVRGDSGQAGTRVAAAGRKVRPRRGEQRMRRARGQVDQYFRRADVVIEHRRPPGGSRGVEDRGGALRPANVREDHREIPRSGAGAATTDRGRAPEGCMRKPSARRRPRPG
jgi:hypothetical protein